MSETLLYVYNAGPNLWVLNSEKAAPVSKEDKGADLVILDESPFLASVTISEDKTAGLHDVIIRGHAEIGEFVWKATDAAVLPFFFTDNYYKGVYDGLVSLTIKRGVPTLIPVESPLIETSLD